MATFKYRITDRYGKDKKGTVHTVPFYNIKKRASTRIQGGNYVDHGCRIICESSQNGAGRNSVCLSGGDRLLTCSMPFTVKMT